jgi:hypothetical protein
VIANADLTCIFIEYIITIRPKESEPIAEAAKYIVIGSAICQPEERIHINGKIWSDLIDQTSVQCADPWAGPDRVVKFKIATQISDNRARESDWILPLHRLLLLRGLSRMSILV